MSRTTTRTWPHVGALAMMLVLSGCASTGSIVGTLQLPAAARSAAPAAHAQGPSPPVSHAVVYVEELPSRYREAAGACATRTMVQRKGGFAPAVLAVPAGTPVVFRNDDAVYHSVFSVSPAKRFDLGMYKPGQRSRPVTFDKPGVVQLFCSLDASMSGHVLVLPHACFTRPDRNGGFTLAGLPPGTYTVKAWHPSFGTVSRRVDLGHRRSARLKLQLAEGPQAQADH